MKELLQRWCLTHGDEVLWEGFDEGALSRGTHYFEQGFVLDLVTASTSCYARIGESGRAVTYTWLRAQSLGSRYPVQVQCTCGVKGGCEHGVAALVAYLDRCEADADQQVPAPLRLWLADVEQAATRAEAAEGPKEQLVYVVSINKARNLRVDAYKTRLRKDGRYGKMTVYQGDGDSGARFLNPVDQRILPLIESQDRRVDPARVPMVLRELAALERVHVNASDGPVLTLGPEQQGLFEWRGDDDGNQKLTCYLPHGNGTEMVVAGRPLWYVDPSSGVAGPVATDAEDELAVTLLKAPAVAPESVAAVREPLTQLGVDIPVPEAPSEHRLSGVAPTPHLHLAVHALLPDEISDQALPEDYEPAGTLHFDYGEVEIPAEERRAEPAVYRGNTLWRIERDKAAEQQAWDQLATLGLEPYPDATKPLFIPETIEDWYPFVAAGMPRLEAAGWRITADDDFPFRLVEPDDWYAALDEASGEAWFDLELGVEIDGERQSIVPLLTQLIQQQPEGMSQAHLDNIDPDTSLLLDLGDGRILPVPARRVTPMLRTLVELYDPERAPQSERVRLPTTRAGALSALEAEADLRWEGDTQALEYGRRLSQLQRVEPADSPAGLEANLRDYQRTGVGWLQALADQGLGGVLADDMGLGKTVQVLAHLLRERERGRQQGPSLVVAPLSLLFNWEREAERFAPELSVLRLHGSGRHAYMDRLGDWDLVLTTYALITRDSDALAEQGFHLVVLDEAQAVKNPQAKSAQAVRHLSAYQRLCLTGTPLENHLDELWAQFDFLLPGLLGDQRRFRRLFRRPIEREGDSGRQQALKQRIEPFLLRRSKQAIAAELPAKTEIQREAELTGEQRDLYETVRASMQEKVRAEIDRHGLERSQVVILDALLKLRQVCCDPRLLNMESARNIKRSAKLDLLLELLRELRDEGRQILLFSQFTSMLTLIEQALKGTGIDYVKLTGQTKKREERINRFQAGEVPLFLISLKAGGTGLNLTAADTVIHYDPWWNPAVMDQATDRAHRIGQDKPVFAYHLLTRNTVEERIMALQQRKAELGNWLLGGDSGSTGALEMADVEALLQPLE